MSRASLSIQRRDASDKSPSARRLRRTGRTPGILYHEKGNQPFSADSLELAAVIRRNATLVDADMEGDGHLTLVKEVQRHPVRGDIEHLDLQAVRLDQSVRTVVHIDFQGEPVGAEEGGVVTWGLTEVHVECIASSIPESLAVNLEPLNIGDSILLKDLETPEGVTILDELEQLVASVTVPRALKSDEEEAEGEEGAEAAEGEAGAEAAAEGEAGSEGGDEG